MASVKGVLFIDTTQYLNLYRTSFRNGKTLLASLTEQQDHIFVTTQVVEEVQRRKLEVTANFLTQQCKTMKPRNFDALVHLFGTDDEVGHFRTLLQEIENKIKAAHAELTTQN